jgi:phasin family protein
MAQQANKKSFNPFEGFENFMNFNNSNNFSNMVGNMDFNKMKNLASKNMQVMTDASQMMMEGMQAFARRAGQLMQEQGHRNMESFKSVCSCRSPEEFQSNGANYMANAMQQSCENFKEMTEMAAKTMTSLADTMNKRMADVHSEWNASCNSGAANKK